MIKKPLIMIVALLMIALAATVPVRAQLYRVTFACNNYCMHDPVTVDSVILPHTFLLNSQLNGELDMIVKELYNRYGWKRLENPPVATGNRCVTAGMAENLDHYITIGIPFGDTATAEVMGGYNTDADWFNYELAITVTPLLPAPPMHTLTNIPDGWAVEADGNAVTVTNGTALVAAGAMVRLIPPTGVKPSVKAVKAKGAVPLTTPLTLEALTDGTILVNGAKVGMQYSLNGGVMHFVDRVIDVVAGDKIALYGNGTNISCYNGTNISGGTAEVKVYGNIMSLLDETGFALKTSLNDVDYTFMGLFAGNNKIIDASGLLLPATTLSLGTYFNMFYGCTALTSAPELPATKMAVYSYYNMFNGCTSLTHAPELPATMLDIYCYTSMFDGCTSLAYAPALPATTLAEGCYASMFEGCTSLTHAPALPATTLAKSCYEDMFNGCTSLTHAPALPATTLAEDCYQGMFLDCRALTYVPDTLPATTLAKLCYYLMFSGCTSMTTAPVLPATTLAEDCYYQMFYNCTSLTHVPDTLPATTLAVDCYYEMFSDCTSMTTAPVLPATMLVGYCYKKMFSGCSSLNSVTCLATNISATDCTSGWLGNISTNGTLITPNCSMWASGDDGIPAGWTCQNE